MSYHGLLRDVVMWDTIDIDVKKLYSTTTIEKDISIPLTTWNVSSILIWTPNDTAQPLLDLDEQYGLIHGKTPVVKCDDELKPSSTTRELKVLPMTTKLIKPVILPRAYEPVEATGSEAYGSVCLIAIGALISIIVFSDLRYFERVLPIMKRNFKTGMSRLYRVMMRQSIIRSMIQMMALTARLGETSDQVDRSAVDSNCTLNNCTRHENDQDMGQLGSASQIFVV